MTVWLAAGATNDAVTEEAFAIATVGPAICVHAYVMADEPLMRCVAEPSRMPEAPGASSAPGPALATGGAAASPVPVLVVRLFASVFVVPELSWMGVAFGKRSLYSMVFDAWSTSMNTPYLVAACVDVIVLV